MYRKHLSWVLSMACLVAGCATPPPAPSAATASPAAKPAAVAAGATSTVAVKKPPAGYRARVRQGETFYCRTEPVSGSRFGKELCWTPEDLERMLENNKTEVDDLFRKQPACGMEGCR